MRRLCVVLGFAAVSALSTTGCGARQVQVGTSPTTAASTLHLTNSTGNTVNVYVIDGTTETFIRQVGANSTADLPVRGVAMGAQVRFRAVSLDGKYVYDSNPMVISASNTWRITQ